LDLARLSYEPHGAALAAPGPDGVVQLLDADGSSLGTLLGHRAEVAAARFSPEGQSVLSASLDGTLRRWRRADGRPEWFGTVVLHAPAAYLTHRGWIGPDGAPSASLPAGRQWRTAAEHADAGEQSEEGTLLCLGSREGKVELWDLGADRRLAQVAVQGLAQLVAIGSECLARARDGDVVRLSDTKETKTLRMGAAAIARDGSYLLVALERTVERLDAEGNVVGSYPSDVGVTALGRVGKWLAIGHSDGNIDLVPVEAGAPAPNVAFEAVPSSAVERIAEGPSDTLAAGYATGVVGLWRLDNGRRILSEQLHGPVRLLLLSGARLWAGTELGMVRSLDLGVLGRDYCDVLREVWAEVPVVWHGGVAVLRAPPTDHPCANEQPRASTAGSP
jgi:WD40 repeat protein